MKIARRVEKMYAQKMLAEIFGETFGDMAYGNTARVRCDDRASPSVLFDPLEKFSLDLKIFDDRLYDNVALFDLSHVVIEISHADKRRRLRREERGGPGLLRGFKACARDAVAHIFRF